LAGWSAAGIFEGGGMPLIRRIPKRGFHNAHAPMVKGVNVGALEEAFAAGAEVTPQALREAGIAKGIWDQIKILGTGDLRHALRVSAHRFSAQARTKIEAAGGTCTVIPGPAPLVRRVKKVSRKKPAGG
jgi:large subunit ribosomal protein L15